jgi:hypothetical protein
MNWVDQSIIDDGRGDCLRACVATVLELQREDVPNFAELDYFSGLHDWLSNHGYQWQEIRFADATHAAQAWFGYSTQLVVMWGDSPRFRSDGKRRQHSVAGMASGYGLELVHDPHPSRDGLHGPPYGVMWIQKRPGAPK